ncbi:MAG: hypothetical protein M1820_001864 [Bogoriella megaspora]|nr:MAG: hypothetical protein M1820_001864 [Bogoriella megaspora]
MIFLVTGANRGAYCPLSFFKHVVLLPTDNSKGLGRGFVEILLLRSDTTVIATTRSSSQFSHLSDLAKHPSSQLITVAIESESKYDAIYAVEDLQQNYSIAKLDVVIACAGATVSPAPAAEVAIQDIQNCFMVNTIAPLLLFQATKPLLERAASPKFVVISSIAGSLGEVPSYTSPCAAYGTSKAATNFLVLRIGKENPGLLAMALHPGWIRTDMGNAAATRAGKAEAPITISEAVEGVLQEIDTATEESSGAFRTFDHQILPW